MMTGLLKNKYICISNKPKTQIKDLNRFSHVLIGIVSKRGRERERERETDRERDRERQRCFDWVS